MALTPYHSKYFVYELTRQVSSDKDQRTVASVMDAQVNQNYHRVGIVLKKQNPNFYSHFYSAAANKGFI